jgi:FkbM family methyltransferase
MQSYLSIANKIRYHLLTLLWEINCFFIGDRKVRFTLAEGSQFDYPLKTTIGRLLWVDNFEKAELKFLIESLKPGDIFFDVGANGGIFTVIAAKKVGSTGHVYAFEPGLRELKILRENICLNNLTNVTIVESVVSNKSGTSVFALSKDGAMNSIFETSHPSQKIESWTTVPAVTIDDFIRAKKIEKVSFLKVDVEGAEKMVFEGAETFLGDCTNLIVVFESAELASSIKESSTQHIINRFCELGFEMNILDPHLGLIPMPGDEIQGNVLRSNFNFVAIKK